MIMWKGFLKWLKRLLGGALLLSVVAYLALLAVNWRDRPPSEDAMRLAALYQNRPTVSAEDNGYVYAMGFATARNGDPHAAGLRRVEWLREIPDDAQSPLNADPAPDDQSYKSARSPAAQSIAEACRSPTHQCIAALGAADEAIRDWLQSEEWLLDRYMTLLRHEGWLETAIFDERAPLPSYAMVLDAQKLLLAKASILASRKDAAGVRSLLTSDVRFWRRVLDSSDILITKMIAVAALKRTYGVGNLALRRLPPELAMDGMPQEWTAPMTDAERSLMRCLVGEWLYADRLMKHMEASGSWQSTVGYENDAGVANRLLRRMTKPLFQPQDLSNRRAEMFIKLVHALNAPFDQFPAALARAEEITQPSDEFILPSVYNPIGDILLWIGSPAFAPYGARVTDLEGIRRAAVLTTELRSRRVPAERVPGELKASGVRGYTSAPFGWDAEEGAIVFTGLEPNERGRHVFKY